MTTADPITGYIMALERALHGPRRTRRCMIAEAHAGLCDAAESYRAGGLAPDRAAELAVRDFGEVHEVAPSFQDELIAWQGRWAAVLLAILFPAMLVGWDLLWMSGTVTRKPGPAPDLVSALATVEDAATAVVAIAALALLAITFRRTVSPRRLTSAIGLTGTVGALACGGLAVAMNVAGGQATATLLATNPAAVAAFTGTGVVMILLVWQSVRTLRVARAT
ncbi:permease prefix domain 1-containing protein [Streptomyces sp. 6N223]|uniref:permease prefix domain 1-containing protein n=1 Tax=Streptomyces sp. 6N223 TaxID=3457412 RepID=UPI003FCF2518